MLSNVHLGERTPQQAGRYEATDKEAIACGPKLMTLVHSNDKFVEIPLKVQCVGFSDL